MGKPFAIVSLIIAVFLLLIFGADVSPLKMPFKQASKTMDYGFLVCGGLMAYLSWRTLREQR